MSHFSSTSTFLVVVFICPNLLRMVNAGDKDKGHTIIVKSGEQDRYGYHHPHIIPIPVPVPIHHGHHGHFFARRTGQQNPGSSSSSNGESASESTNSYTPSPYITPFGSGLPLPMTSWLSQSMMSNPFMSGMSGLPGMSGSLISPSSIYQLMFGANQHISHRADSSPPSDSSGNNGKGSSALASETGEAARNGDLTSNDIVPAKSPLNLTPGVLHPVFTPDYSSMFNAPSTPSNNGFMWKFTPVSDSNDYWTR